MKIIILFLLASCLASLAEISTNTDSSGYVTNANLLAPFTVTNFSTGLVFTDAVLMKLMPNKCFYKTPGGAIGMLRLEALPQALLQKIGYDPTNALAADLADRQKKERQDQYFKQQRENAAAQAAQNVIWTQVESHRRPFAVTGDSLKVEQITKDGVLASYNLVDLEGVPRSLMYFVKGIPNQNSLANGAIISGPFYEIGTYGYTSVMGASEARMCLTCSPQMAFDYYSTQAGVQAGNAKSRMQQQLAQQKLEASVPKAQRDAIWQRVQAHERNFDQWLLDVRQITKDGLLVSLDHDTDIPGQHYFVKDYPGQEALYVGSSPNTLLSDAYYEIGTYTYTTVGGAGETIPCLTCSKDAAFQYYMSR